MDANTTSRIKLSDLSPLERLRKIKVNEAAALNNVHPSTFRRNYGHLIKRIGQRTDVVTVEDAVTLPPPETVSKAKRG